MSAAPRLIIVVAAADNDVIGCDGKLPWHLPDDLKRFKALTMAKPIIMGRRTHESIGRALPGRANIVVSRTAMQSAAADPVQWVQSLDAALKLCQGLPEVFVIGGAELYRHALPLADVVELTRVHAGPRGDVYFAALPEAQWLEVAREEHVADARHEYAMSFLTYHRRAKEP